MGSDAMQKDIGEAARDLEKNLDKMSLGDNDSEEELDAPVFTHELAKMKAQAMGEKFEQEDEEMDDEENKDNYP